MSRMSPTLSLAGLSWGTHLLKRPVFIHDGVPGFIFFCVLYWGERREKKRREEEKRGGRGGDIYIEIPNFSYTDIL